MHAFPHANAFSIWSDVATLDNEQTFKGLVTGVFNILADWTSAQFEGELSSAGVTSGPHTSSAYENEEVVFIYLFSFTLLQKPNM